MSLLFMIHLPIIKVQAKALGCETLKSIARELTVITRKNTTIDWTMRESFKAGVKSLGKKVAEEI